MSLPVSCTLYVDVEASLHNLWIKDICIYIANKRLQMYVGSLFYCPVFTYLGFNVQ
jgi:hypothetical protein